MSDQVVELRQPGMHILLYAPFAALEMREGGDYAATLPDGRDLVDHVNDCSIGVLSTRFPDAHHWLHFSASMDHGVISRASDHLRLGVEVRDGQLCVRGGDDLFRWRPKCPDEQIVSLEDGFYEVTACMVPYAGEGPVRIYLHFARAAAKPELGYHRLPELYCDVPAL
jgi:hypothetical protein